MQSYKLDSQHLLDSQHHLLQKEMKKAKFHEPLREQIMVSSTPEVFLLSYNNFYNNSDPSLEMDSLNLISKERFRYICFVS